MTIGGFLELEKGQARKAAYHDAKALSTGRSCFRAVLELIEPSRVHVPFFVCDALLEPLRELEIEVCFTSLRDDLSPRRAPETCGSGELYVDINFFGLQGRSVANTIEMLGDHAVIDDSQAFFRKGSSRSWSFNSARKFFGVPDGAYLHGPGVDDVRIGPPATPGSDHLTNRSLGLDELAYQQFRAHEASLDDEPRAMSELSQRLLRGIDYDAVAYRRRQNYAALDAELASTNRLKMELHDDDVPLYYPYLPSCSLHESLIRMGIFVPRLWAEILTRPGSEFAWERELAERLCPLPVDQRYCPDAMGSVATKVRKAAQK